MILKRMYRSDHHLENFAFLESAIESNNSEELDVIIHQTIQEFHKKKNILIDHLLLESTVKVLTDFDITSGLYLVYFRLNTP